MYWQLIKRMGDAVLDMAKKYADSMVNGEAVMSGDRYVREKVNGDKCRAEFDPTATLWGVRPKGKVRIGKNQHRFLQGAILVEQESELLEHLNHLPVAWQSAAEP